jgi:serralysin
MDYEVDKSLYSINISVTDGQNTVNQSLSVELININDNLPVLDLSSSIDVEENQVSVTTIKVSDADNDTLSLSMTGQDAGYFSLSTDNELTFNNPMDYENDQQTFLLSFNLTSGSDTINRDVTVNLINVNDISPQWNDGNGGVLPNGFNIYTETEENDLEPIGQVLAEDTIENDTITYRLDGDDKDYLSITADGLVSFKQAPDFETKNEYVYNIVASDGVNEIYLLIDHKILNLNDVAPVITSESTLSADENQTSIGTLSISDPDPGVISFTITGDDSSSVRINRDGVISFINAPDFETKTSYSFSVTVSDGINATTTAFTININDLDDVFTDIAGYKVPTSIDVIETKE